MCRQPRLVAGMLAAVGGLADVAVQCDRRPAQQPDDARHAKPHLVDVRQLLLVRHDQQRRQRPAEHFKDNPIPAQAKTQLVVEGRDQRLRLLE